MNITRRAFLRTLGLTLGGLVLAGCNRRRRPNATPVMPSCYEPTPSPIPSPSATPEARLDQLRALQVQARLLDGLSAESGLDPTTVARVRAAIERDAAALAAPRGLAAAIRQAARLLSLPA